MDRKSSRKRALSAREAAGNHRRLTKLEQLESRLLLYGEGLAVIEISADSAQTEIEPERPFIASSRDAAKFSGATSLNRLNTRDELKQTGVDVVIGLWDADGYPWQMAVDQYGPPSVNQAIDTTTPDWGGIADFSEHATVIAEVLLGDTPTVKPSRVGIAPDAYLRVADGTNDLPELNETRADLDISLHPYNIAAGWEWIPEEATQHPQHIRGQFVWFGDIDQLLTGDDDAAFGRYTMRAQDVDAATEPTPSEFSEERLLTVWSAGNNTGDHPDWTGIQPRQFFFKVETQADFQRLGFRLVTGQTFSGPDYYALQANFPLPPADGHASSRYSSTIPGAANAKNVLTVGAVDMPTNVDSTTGRTSVATQLTGPQIRRLDVSASSGRGPTDDGRIKPDLVAPGGPIELPDGIEELFPGESPAQSGASIAAAVVAGHAANVRELHRELETGNARGIPTDGDVLKAVLLHTATDIGLAGPDYESGFGLVNGTTAAEFLQRAYGTRTTSQNDPESLLRKKTYSGTAVSRKITIDPHQGAKITLYWDDLADLDARLVHDDSTSTLVNDLDVYLVGPDGTHYYPLIPDPDRPDIAASQGISNTLNPSLQNHRDNVEQIVIDSTLLPSDAGLQEYTVVVSHTGTYTPLVDDPISYVMAIDSYYVQNAFSVSVGTGDVTRLDLRHITGGQTIALPESTPRGFQPSNDPSLQDSLFFAPPLDPNGPIEYGEAISLVDDGDAENLLLVDFYPSLVSDAPSPHDLFQDERGLQRAVDVPIRVDGALETLRIQVQIGYSVDGQPDAVDLETLDEKQIAQRLSYLGYRGAEGDTLFPFASSSDDILHATLVYRAANQFSDPPLNSPGPAINSPNAPVWGGQQLLTSSGIELLPQGQVSLAFGTDWAWDAVNRIGENLLTLPAIAGGTPPLPIVGLSDEDGLNTDFETFEALHDGGNGVEFALPSSTDLSRPFYRIHPSTSESLIAAATDTDPNGSLHHVSVAKFEVDARFSIGSQVTLGGQLTSSGAAFDFSQLRFDGRERIRLFESDAQTGLPVVPQTFRILAYNAATGAITIDGQISAALAADPETQAELYFSRANTAMDENSLRHNQASYQDANILDALVGLIVSNPDLNGNGVNDDPYRLELTEKYLTAIASQLCDVTDVATSSCITDIHTSDPRVWEKHGGIAGVDPPPRRFGLPLESNSLADQSSRWLGLRICSGS